MNIIIVGDQTERLEIIRQLLDEISGWNVSILSLENMESSSFSASITRADVTLVDLAYVSEAAPLFIKEFKGRYSGTRLIGVHFYRNIKLIDPLLEAGLDGYVHSNSNKHTLFEAIEDVYEGKEYVLKRMDI